MHFGVLGPLEVRTDEGALVVVPGGKERLLLAVLVAAVPGVVGVDRLAEVLWSDAQPVTARKSLQAHVVRLRSALEPERPRGSTGRYVVRRGPGYALAVARSDVDALRAADLAAHGRAVLASGDAGSAAVDLAAARELWRGEPYADWPDAAFADVERRRLEEVRASVVAGLLEAQLALGRHAEVVPELERLVAEQPLREQWWSLLLLALYRDGRQADALSAARRVRALLADELGADPGPDLRAVEAAVLEQSAALDLPRQRRPPLVRPSGTCPYKGLASYQPGDAALFRGRRHLVAGLVRRLADATLLVVSGPSGAGKSSAVRAGLVPALAGNALPGSGTWRTVLLTPGARPVDALAELTGDPAPDGPVLLVCDQLEELWAPATEPAERAAFLDAVLALLDDGVVVRVVAVVRGDHLGRLAEHPGLAERVAGAVVLVPPLSDAELREVVSGPAEAVGLHVEPELLDAVAADVLGRAGALPLLSTALVGTWERRRGALLTLAGYLEAGGVAGALARTAEQAYGGLDEAGRRQARQVLVRLADADDDGVVVRRPLPLAALGPAHRDVVEAFVVRRLLAVDDGRIEVAHESLLTAWPRLARWLEDDAAGRAVRRRLAPAALEWDLAGRPDEEVYRGARLAAALEWAATPGADLTPVEQAFLDAARTGADHELAATRRRAEQEAAGRHRTRRLAGLLAVALVLALVAAGLAVDYERAAQERAVQASAASVVADANRLAALSTTVGSLDVALLLAAQAVRLADTPETQDGLLAVLLEHGRAVRAVPFAGAAQGSELGNGGTTLFIGIGPEILSWAVGPTALPTSALELGPEWGAWRGSAASPREPVLAASGWADDEPWVRLVGAGGQERVLARGASVGGFPLDVAFTADGRSLRLLVADGGQGPDDVSHWSLREVDRTSGVVRATRIGGSLPGAPGQPAQAELSADGRRAVLWAGRAAVLLDLATGRSTPLRLEQRPSTSLGLLAVGDGVTQQWVDGAVTRYDATGAAVQTLDAHLAPVRDVVLAPDASWAATVGDAAAVVLWDVDRTSGRWTRREALTGHDGDVVGAEVAPGGRLLFTVARNGQVITWDLSDEGGFGSSFPPLQGRFVSNRPQVVVPGELMVAPTRPVSRSGADPRLPAEDTVSVAATFLDPGTGRVVDQVVVGDTFKDVLFGSSVAVSPDSTRVAVTSARVTTVLDTRTRAVLARVELPPVGGVGPDGERLDTEIVWGAGWTPDGRLLLGSGGRVPEGTGGAVVVVDPGTWQVQRRIPVGDSVQTLETSPDGRFLAVADAGSPRLHVLDARTLQVLRTLELDSGDFLYDLSFSPDGSRVAAGGEQGLVHVWDTGTWEPVHDAADVHRDRVLQVEWTPDGRTVVSAGNDGTIGLYDAVRGLRRSLPLPASSTPGGYTHLVPGVLDDVVALSGERPGRRYPTRPGRWLAEACTVVGRDLNAAEWERYLPGRAPERTCGELLSSRPSG